MLASVWLALAGLVASEIGQARRRRTGIEPRWAWPASLAGCLALAAHMAWAMSDRHEWSHQSALRETARQTAEVYGVAFGGGLFVNYAFVLVWAAMLLWWKASPAAFWRQPAWLLWATRAFVFVVVFNAAVIFAAPERRLAGATATLTLAAAWIAPSWRVPRSSPPR